MAEMDDFKREKKEVAQGGNCFGRQSKRAMSNHKRHLHYAQMKAYSAGTRGQEIHPTTETIPYAYLSTTSPILE